MLSSADILQLAGVVHEVVLYFFVGLHMAKPYRKIGGPRLGRKKTTEDRSNNVSHPHYDGPPFLVIRGRGVI